MKTNKKKFLISILTLSTLAIASSVVVGVSSVNKTQKDANSTLSDSIETYTSVPMPGPTMDEPFISNNGGNNGGGITTNYEIDWSNRGSSKNVFFEDDFAYTNSSKTTLLGMDPNTTSTTVSLPSSVNEIKGYTRITNEKSSKKYVGAFEDIISIESVTIEGANVKIDANAFKGCTSLKIVDIKNNAVRSIGKSAFEGCISLEAINLSTSLNTIEESSFKDTKSLTQISLPNNLSTIGKSAFENSGLKNVDMTKTKVKSIGDNAFKNTNKLSKVFFSNQLRSVGNSAFEGSGITTIMITSRSLNNIGIGAFKDCFSLTSFKMTFKTFHLTTIPESIFENCTNLNEIQFTSSSGTQSFRTIGKNAFKGTKISTLNITNVQKISESAFENCSSLNSLTGQNVLQTIGNSAFKNSSLKVITSTRGNSITSNITTLSSILSIGDSAFYGTKIVEFKSGSYLTNIGDDSFKNIDTLKHVDFTLSKGLTRNDNAFDDKDKNKIEWPKNKVFRGNKIIF